MEGPMSRKLVLGSAVVVMALAAGCNRSQPQDDGPASPTPPAQPADNGAEEAEARLSDARTSQANLQQIGAAFNHNPSYVLGGYVDHDGKPILSWRVALLPALGEEKLFRNFKLNE